MISQWKAFLMARSEDWGLPSGGDWSFFFHNNYHSHHSNINVLWFHNGDQFPRVVTKIFREPQIPQRELENLRRAYGLAPAWTPKPLHCGLHGEFWTLWMEGVPGSRFWNFSPARLRSVVEMLASMHAALHDGAAKPDPHRYRRTVSEPLHTLQHFGQVASIREGCAKLAERASVTWLDSQPVIPQHGDLFLDNVLSYRDQWHIVDWESFGVIDLPFYDLYTLLVSRFRADGEVPDQWDRSLTTQTSALVQQYAERLNLPAGDIRLLLPLTLVNWFHLQWSDGRKEFTRRMYKMIQHYFEHTNVWESVFFGPGFLGR
jgi:aminoglycoside phosphotransferase (APT) family kinase protein